MKAISRFPIFLVFILVFTTACERESRPLGGAAGASLGEPVYTATEDVSAVSRVSYVESVAPKAAGEAAPADPAALYTVNCAACHQAAGQGIPAVFPPLDGSPYVTGENVERLAAIMIYGLIGPVKVLGQQYQGAMAPLGGSLSDEQLAVIASYIRSSWSNSAGPVEAQLFADVRAKFGTRGPFSIQELGEEE